MRKKILAALLVMIMVLMAGCTPKQEPTPGPVDEVKPVSITIWHYFSGAQQEALNAIVEEFNQTIGAEKKITVIAENQGYVADLEKKIQTAADAGLDTLPEIIHGYPDITATLHAKGFVADMGSYIDAADLEDYFEGFIREGSQFEGGEFRLMPVAKSTELLFLNKTLWDNVKDQIGATDDSLKTWEGLAAAGKAYAELTGKFFFGIDSLANFFYLGGFQQGHEFVTPGEFTPNEEAEQKIYNFLATGIAENWLVIKDANKKYNSDFINDGTAVAYVGSNSGATYVFPVTEVGQETEDELACLPYPVFEGGTAAVIQQGAGMSIAKKGETIEKAAVEFLLFLTNSDNTAAFSMASGYMPVRKSAQGNDVFKAFLSGVDADGNPLNDKNTKTALAINAALAQFEVYELYYTPAFNNSNVIRRNVDDELGKVLSTLHPDFASFYESLNAEVQKTLTGR